MRLPTGPSRSWPSSTSRSTTTWSSRWARSATRARPTRARALSGTSSGRGSPSPSRWSSRRSPRGARSRGSCRRSHLDAPPHQTFFTLDELQSEVADRRGVRQRPVRRSRVAPASCPARRSFRWSTGASRSSGRRRCRRRRWRARSSASRPRRTTRRHGTGTRASLRRRTSARPRASRRQAGPAVRPGAFFTTCGRWLTPTFDIAAYNTDGDGKTEVLTFGTMLGQLWDAFDDTGSDVTGKIRFTALKTATVDTDPNKYVHATMSVDIVSTDRRYPQLILSDQPAPVQEGMANPNANALLFQAIQGPGTRIELQAIHGLVNGHPWDVNNQATEHVLVQPDFSNGAESAIAPDVAIDDHMGVDRMTRFDVYVSSQRAYLFVDGAPAGCTAYPTGLLPRGRDHVHRGRRALPRGRGRRARVRLPEALPVPARAPVHRDQAPLRRSRLQERSRGPHVERDDATRAVPTRADLLACAAGAMLLGACGSARRRALGDGGGRRWNRGRERSGSRPHARRARRAEGALSDLATPAAGRRHQRATPTTLPPRPSDRSSSTTRRSRGPLLDTDNDGSAQSLGMAGQTGRVACAGCHVPASGFSDTRSFQLQISLGAGWGRRRAPSLLDVGQAQLIMWDGRRDALYDQPFGPLESVVEMNSSRLYMAEQLYARVPGPTTRRSSDRCPRSATRRSSRRSTRRSPGASRRTPRDPQPDLRRDVPRLAGRPRGVRRHDRREPERRDARRGQRGQGHRAPSSGCCRAAPSAFDAWMHGGAPALARGAARSRGVRRRRRAASSATRGPS